MEDIIKELLNGKSFEQILRKYELERYELLEIISNKLYISKEQSSPEEIEELKRIYRKEATLFQLTNEKVMFISDTHMESSFEKLNLIKGAFCFCHENNIHYLIHGGDIADGTCMVDNESKNIDFDEAPKGIATKQAEQILEKYPHDFSINQLILGGNHDERYACSKDKIDLLKYLSQYKNVYPLGYYQAFFSIYNQVISLEHFSNRNLKREQVLQLVPHTLKIKGHYHIGQFSQESIFLPALSYRIAQSETERLPGFIIMQASETEDSINIKFDRFFYIKDILYPPTHPYILTRKKK